LGEIRDMTIAFDKPPPLPSPASGGGGALAGSLPCKRGRVGVGAI